MATACLARIAGERKASHSTRWVIFRVVVCAATHVAAIKASDRSAAFLEATRLAGFSLTEARRFFGPPPKFSATIERNYLTPWPAETAEARFLERFAKLAHSDIGTTST